VGFSQALTAGLTKSHCQISPKGNQPGKISLLCLSQGHDTSESKVCFPEELSFAFFAWLAHLWSTWRSGFGQALPDDRRAPEGLGAWGNPLRQVDCPRASKAKRSPYKVLEWEMQQPQLTTYAEIAEVRTVTGASTCNQLLSEGWVLLGVIPLTSVREMGARQSGNGEQDKRIEDTQRYVRRLVGYVVGKKREA
jgi:hypothetical protein